MAGEKRGLAFEALTALVLERATGSRIGTGIHWNHTPSGLTIVPDFTVGTDPDVPDAVVLVSFPASYLNSNFKFWRNLAELWEAKVLVRSRPVVISIQFGKGMKGDLTTLAHYAFDAQIDVLPTAENSALLEHITDIASSLPADGTAKIEVVRKSLDHSGVTVKGAVRRLVITVRKALAARSSLAESIWEAERACVAKRLISMRPARQTALRRGLSKLLIARDPDNIIDSIYRRHPAVSDPVFLAAGLMTKSIGGMRVTDADLNALPVTVPRDTLRAILKSIVTRPAIKTLIAPVRELPVMKAVIKHIASHWGKLTSPDRLWMELSKSQADPHAYATELGVVGCDYVRPGIVADAVLTIMRCASKKRQFFGNAGLIQHLELQRSKPSLRSRLETLSKKCKLRDVTWRSATTVSYGFRDWVFGAERTNFTLTEFELLRVSEALSHQMTEFDGRQIKTVEAAVLPEWLDELIENKIGAYREFRPLDVLLESVLKTHLINFERVNYYPSVWHQKARLDGKKINMRAGTTTLYRTANALLKTQSVSDAGSGHKKKELMARAVSLRYSATGNRARSVGQKLVLLIDGTFSDADLQQLAAAGWDAIFYPDEMDQLVKAIV